MKGLLYCESPAIVQISVTRYVDSDMKGHGMAESAGQKRVSSWRRVASLTLVVVGLAATSAIAATVTAAPTISGVPANPADFKPGTRLTASTGSWTPPSARATYDWLRCNASGAGCVGITGACGREYTVRKADEGHTLRVRLTATEPGGQPDTGDSSPTRSVATDDYFLPPENEPDTCIDVTPTGAGQGTFSSGAELGAGSEPAADTSLPFIDPFPVIRISGRFKGKRTKLTRVTVKAPRGARIRINCKGRGCPYKRKAVAVRFIRVRSLQRTYRPKATIEIRVTQSKKIGKYTRVRTRRNKAPLRLDRCLRPGKTRPVVCPQG